ncbi:MAG: molybdate ABC transporter permease subunit [Campylobacteraceae bacterium]|jgi:molybdate transport system permease protein|nr:molybdate ABC transporter permease subunit [Campylobacteraceae bacterium]
MIDFTPFFISLKLSIVTTIILFILCLPLSWWLSQTKSKTKPILEALTTLSLVLPPTVLGFYILVLLSPINSPIGIFLDEYFGIRLVFNFSGMVIASCIFSLPFMLHPLQSGFESLNKNIIEASYLCGKGKIETILKVALPNIKPSLIVALVITFAHTMGEFGVILLVGGSGANTKVASIAIYNAFEASDFTQAHILSAMLLIISFLVLLIVYIFNKKHKISPLS